MNWCKFSEIEASTLENIHKLSDINYVISNENGIFANKNKVIKIKQILENGTNK